MRGLKSEFWLLVRWEYDQTIENFQSNTQAIKKNLQNASDRSSKLSTHEDEKRREIVNLQKSTVNIDVAIANINNRLVNLRITEFSIQKYSDVLYRIVRQEGQGTEFLSLSEGEKMIASILYFVELSNIGDEFRGQFIMALIYHPSD